MAHSWEACKWARQAGAPHNDGMWLPQNAPNAAILADYGIHSAAMYARSIALAYGDAAVLTALMELSAQGETPYGDTRFPLFSINTMWCPSSLAKLVGL